MRRKPYVADDFLLGPGIFDSPAALRPDPLDHFEPGGVVFDDVENSFAELLHELACIHVSMPDEAGAEVFLDAFAGVGGGGGEQLRAELHAEVPVALPFAFGGEPFAWVGRDGSDPRTVTSSRWPFTRVLRMQKPVSSLKKVTRSMSPEIDSP